MILDLAVQLYGDISGLRDFLFGQSPPPVTEMGPREDSIELSYAADEVPESVVVGVVARPKLDSLTLAHEVAQVRLEDDNNSTGFIVDFQALRTVSMIQVPVPSGASVEVFPWIGTRFDDKLTIS